MTKPTATKPNFKQTPQKRKADEMKGTFSFRRGWSFSKYPELAPLTRLFDIMTYQRPARSAGEDKFLRRYLDPLMQRTDAWNDSFGNYCVNILRSDGTSSSTLFSCHTDMVCTQPNENFENVLLYDATTVTAQNRSQLGADDAVGIWLMLELIDANVPGLYIFHRDEEIGGQGSRYISNNYVALMKGVERAIAFDRKSTRSVITAQGCGVCCSTEFATALCSALGMDHIPDDTGVFTDTANYTEIIPECTNISAGYYREHTFDEHLDYRYALKLRDAVLKVEWDKLPTKRDPSVVDNMSNSWWSPRVTPLKPKPQVKPSLNELEEFDNVVDFIRARPFYVAQLLIDPYGMTLDELEYDYKLYLEDLEDLDETDKEVL